jgi:hypothetical protein
MIAVYSKKSKERTREVRTAKIERRKLYGSRNESRDKEWEDTKMFEEQNTVFHR